MNEEILAELKNINEQLGTIVKMLAERKEAAAKKSFGARDHRKGGFGDRDGGRGFGDRDRGGFGDKKPYERKFNLDGKPRVRFDGRPGAKRDSFRKKREF